MRLEIEGDDIIHRDPNEILVRLGREVERRVSACAVRWHPEDGILVEDVRTVDLE